MVNGTAESILINRRHYYLTFVSCDVSLLRCVQVASAIQNVPESVRSLLLHCEVFRGRMKNYWVGNGVTDSHCFDALVELAA